MSSEQSSDIIDSERFSIAELRAAVLGAQGPLSRPLALALLGRKTYPEKAEDLGRVLMSEGEMPRLRIMAAQILGQLRTPDGIRIMERGLGVRDELALRGVIQALGMSRSEKARSALEELGRRGGPTGEAAKDVARLLGYRLGAPASKLAPIETLRLLTVDPADAALIELEAASEREASEAVEQVLQMAPSLRLTLQGASFIRCGGRRLIFLLDEDVAVADSVGLMRMTAEVGVIAGLKEREGSGWELKYSVLAGPAAADEITIVVVTGVGRPIFAGTGYPIDEGVDFEIRSVDMPGAVPVEIKGSYQGNTIVFVEARSGTRRRKAANPSSTR